MENTPVRITIPLPVDALTWLDAMSAAHPYTSRAALARMALVEGLETIAAKFPPTKDYVWPAPGKPRLVKPSETWTR